MPIKDDKKRAKGEGGRGTYVRQACNHCRRRKSKCDGQEPVCGPCLESGREAECTWGKETAKKARTQQHFESLVNHIRTLERRVKELEGELEANPAEGSGSDRHTTPSKSRDYTPLKSDPDEQQPPPDDVQSVSSSTTGDSDIEKLIAPTKKLMVTYLQRTALTMSLIPILYQLRESDLELYGPTSAFQMAQERKAVCDCFADPACPHRIIEQLSAPHLSPSMDWARHLPPEAPISREEHDRLLHLFFCFFSGWCMRIVPEYFLRDMRRALSTPLGHKPPKSSHYSPMLHNAIFTVATAYSDDPRLREVRFREHFARKAKEYIENDCEKPGIPVVMGLSMLASYHATRGEQSLGYMYFGMSGRMAQALGLGIDCSQWVRSGLISEQDAIDRDWAYWGTVTQDVCWSLYVGRGRCFVPHKDQLSGKLPSIPFVDTEIDHAAWSCPPAKFPLQNSNLASVFLATCELLRIGERVTEFVNSLGNDTRHASMQRVSELDIELNTWKDSLSPEVDLTASSRPVALPHRMTLHLTYWWLLILLHRPFYRRHRGGAGDIDHVKLTNRAAENVMLIASNWHSNYSVRFSPITIVQIIFSAGTVFVLSALQAISGPRLGRVTLTTSLGQIQQCVDYLAIIGESWDCSYRVREILLGIVDAQLKPRLLLRSGGAGLPPAPAHAPQQQQQTQHAHYGVPGSPSGSLGSHSQNASPQLDSSALPHQQHHHAFPHSQPPHPHHHAQQQQQQQHNSLMGGGSPGQSYSDPSYSPQWQHALHGSPQTQPGLSSPMEYPSADYGMPTSSPSTSTATYGLDTSVPSVSGPTSSLSSSLSSVPTTPGDVDITMSYPGMVLEFAMAPYDTSLPTQSQAYMPFGTPWMADVYSQNMASSLGGGRGTTPPGQTAQGQNGFSDEELAIMDQIVRSQGQPLPGVGSVQQQHPLDVGGAGGGGVPMHSRR
ncbi:hypothetical protein EIP91_010299 [Steccherinum ochraceum]|uniref:Zn(2)-C6 fungal-type domain-containing protein n=1 Tax=Steccherinum ochraceum TaxID=92696 RepID=A0A4R0RZG0_9APHY|nr:hypothetical protein EIP91_010299 [Steccherinum ochraceum]